MKINSLASVAVIAILAAGAALGHPMTPDDVAKLKNVSDPQVDPSGDWVAYVVKSVDTAADKSFSHLWMTRWDASQTVQLTNRPKESESHPRWSPDGKTLAFLSSRGDAHDHAQVWLLDRTGGEARVLPGVAGSVEDFVWSPDSKSLALIVSDPDPDDAVAKDDKKPKPIVIDRFQFKQDIDGYLGVERSRLWLYDLAAAKAHRLTTGDYDEELPAFSPDGKTIAFISKRGADPDRTYETGLYTAVVSASAAAPKRLAAFNDPERSARPAWRPDGQEIAFIAGGPEKLFSYGVRTLDVVPAAGGTLRILTPALDRNVGAPAWSAEGRNVRFVIEDDGAERLAEISAQGGTIASLIGGRRVVSSPSQGGQMHTALLVSTPSAPDEVFAFEKGQLRPLTHQNEALLKQIDLAAVADTKFNSRDGTEVHGFVVTPPNAVAGVKLPAILFNHGGPQAQYNYGFNPTWQVLAGHGYLVIAANPRGGTGRGEAYAKAIYADWGTLPTEDALAAVDDAVARGLADPARLGVGGWSYGGILTNYIIASDTRFKAAASGASISNVFAGYGTDQYIRDYEMELGRPWEHPDVWMKISAPFFHNEKIVTPTLFMAGDKDFNVPLLNSEQMYQALKSRKVETQLIIYPGQFHGLTRPSFIKDRFDRYLAWFDAHLK